MNTSLCSVGLIVMLYMYHTALCDTADLCKSQGSDVNITLLSSDWTTTTSCRCSIIIHSETVIFLSVTVEEEREDDDEDICRPFLHLSITPASYYVCSESNKTALVPHTTTKTVKQGDVLSLQLHNAKHVRVKVDFQLQVSTGSLRYECTKDDRSDQLQFCPCVTNNPYIKPSAAHINIGKRFGVGFASAIIFLIVLAAIIFLFLFYKRKQEEPAVKTPIQTVTPVAAHRLSNPDLYTPNHHQNHIYADLHDKLPFTPDPTLNLTLRPASLDSGMYSVLPEAAPSRPSGMSSLDGSRPSTPPLVSHMVTGNATYAVPRRKRGNSTKHDSVVERSPSPAAPKLAPRMYSEVYVSMSDMGTNDSSHNISLGTISTDV